MADAPKILGTDTLRQAYPKINAAIDNANEALNKATTAETNSTNAVNTANSVQQQLNQIVIEGDSSVEAAQARVDAEGNVYTTLKERIDAEQIKIGILFKKVSETVSVEEFGAVGDYNETTKTGTDNYQALMDCYNYCVANKKKMKFGKGKYGTTRPLSFPHLIGLEGEGIDASKIIAMAPMETLLTLPYFDRADIRDITIDGGGFADTCVDTTWDTVGPSLNTAYERVFVRGYKKWGWIAGNNNDVYWDKVLIAEPADYNTSLGALKIWGPGGPNQFLNCNFLDLVNIGGQYNSFINCVNRGIVVGGPGFNVLKYEGGYLYTGKNNSSCIYIPDDCEVGPITFSGSHVEIKAGQYLIGGTGKLHYGVNAHGCHIFNYYGGGDGKLIQDTVRSTYLKATSSFSNTWFHDIELIDIVNGFVFSFENCYRNGVPVNNFSLGNRASLFKVEEGSHVKIGRNDYNDGLQIKTGLVSNIDGTWKDLSAETFVNEGIYIVLLNSEHLDAPKGVFIVSIVGGYGNSVTPLAQTPGIASYQGLKYEMQVNNKKLQVRVTGGTGTLTSVGATRYAAFFVKSFK